MPQVAVYPYNPLWATAFMHASIEVVATWGGDLLDIQHIGSTAIPGIYSKPVIDILAVVSDVKAIDKHLGSMESLGYEAMGEFGIPGRRYFRRNDANGNRTHQIHAFQSGSPYIQRHLAFRDFLRAHPALANRYSELKRRLAAAYADNMDSYIEGKDAFLKETESKALIWVATIRR